MNYIQLDADLVGTYDGLTLDELTDRELLRDTWEDDGVDDGDYLGVDEPEEVFV